MAAHTVSRAKTFALTGTGTEDSVTITGGYHSVHVINHSVTTAEKVNVSTDGTTTATTPPDNTDVALASDPQGVVTKLPASMEYTAVVVKLRPLSGTPTVTVRGI